MKKIYTLEETKNNLEDNELLIDKVLNYNKKEISPLTLTANIIKERQELKKEIVDQLNKTEEEKDESFDTQNSSDNTNSSNSNDSSNDANGDSNISSSSNDSDTNKESNSTSNDLDAADNKESLKSLVGSGLKEDSKEKTSQESFKPKLKLSNIFNPIFKVYNKYTTSLESFSIPFKLAIEEQPIVYIKESVSEALNNLITIADIYIAKNKTFIDSNIEAVNNINKKLTVIRQFIEDKKFHFTNKLINDQNLLSNLSITNKSSLRETSSSLIKYIDSSNKFIAFILNNEFEKITSALTNSNFILNNEDFVYKDMLPGFNLIKVHIDKYENYLKANIENFHYYKLKTFKTEDLYNLESISLTSDNDIEYLINNLDKLLVSLSLTIDNFNVANTNLNKLIDEIKVILFDVEKDKYTNLASIDIDSKVKDFIKFKLISEAYYVNANLLMDYILNSMSVINICIKLKD